MNLDVSHSATDVQSVPRVSVVIVSWNAIPLLEKCFPSVAATDYPNLEIIFADNASTDGSSTWISTHYPYVKVVVHPKNWAFCKGNNEAVKHASGEYVVLLNNDVEVPPGWLTPLVDTMEADQRIGAVQPKLLDYHDRARFEYAGGAGGFMDRNGYPFTRGRMFFATETDSGQYDDQREIFWATGAAVMIRKSLYEEFGGLDERLFMHMEEIDFCWRLKRKGHKIVCNPASHVYHIGGGSLPQGSPKKSYYNYRNNLLILYKNLPQRKWPGAFLRRVILDGLGALRAFVILQPNETVSIIRAYWGAHRLKKTMTADRPEPGETEVLPSYRGNLVIDYFLLRRRRFSDLSPKRFT